MASFNHVHHAPGEWQQHRIHVVDDGDDDMDMDHLPPPTQKHSNLSHHHHNNNNNNNVSHSMSHNNNNTSSIMRPPTTTTAAGPQSSFSIEEGAWKGVVSGSLSMSIPRAVSHDQSDELDDSTQRMMVATTSTTEQQHSPSSYDSSEGLLENGGAMLLRAPPPPLNDNEGLGNVSALTHHSPSSIGSLSFAGMGRYFQNDQQQQQQQGGNYEDNNNSVTDGTAYYSAGSGEYNTAKTPPQQRYHSLLDTSVAISMSPSPVKSVGLALSPSPGNSVGDIYENTSLTPSRQTYDDPEIMNHEQNNSFDDNHHTIESSVGMDPRDSTLPVLSVVHDDVSSLPTYVPPSHNNGVVMNHPNHPALDHFDASTIGSNSIQQQQQTVPGPLPQSTIHSNNNNNDCETTNPQNVFVLRGGGSSAQLSSAASSWQTSTSNPRDEALKEEEEAPRPPPLPPSDSSGIAENRSVSSLGGGAHPAFSSWRSSSILVDSDLEEEATTVEEDLNIEQVPTSVENHTSNESTIHNDDSKAGFSLASGLAMPSYNISEEIDQIQNLRSLDNSESDPLYQLQQVSQGDSHQPGAVQQSQQGGIFSPLSAARQATNDPNIHVGLGHYLSSASSGSYSQPEKETEEETGIALSDIDVSRLIKEGNDMEALNSGTNDHGSIKEIRDDDGDSKISAPSLAPSIEEGNDGLSLEATTTPRKSSPSLNLHPKDFSSPATTLRKNSMHISLQESTGYVARIEQLEDELAAAKRSMKEQRDFYDEQTAEQHKFTIPLQPHSPFDPNNHQKHSPGTQQRKLLERNQTLLKEVRFADQTCVQLSEQNAALEGKLEMREEQLEQTRKEYENLKVENASTEALLKEMEQAKEDKKGLERQLHAAYDKLEEKAKHTQSLQEQHAIELEALRASNGNQNESTGKHVKALREQIESVERANEQLKDSLSMRERDLEASVAEKDNLIYQVNELAECKTNYQRAVREKDMLKEKAEVHLAQVDRTSRALHSTQVDLQEARQDLESARRESSDADWKLKQANEKIRELSEVNDQQAAENEFAQEQVGHWKRECDDLQKKLERMSQQESASVRSDVLSKSALLEAQDSEQKFLNEFEVVKKLEADMEEMNAALTILTDKLEAYDGRDANTEMNRDNENKSNAKLSPSLASHLLSLSKSLGGGEILTPQIVQVLQLILSFTQQHLDVIDQKVAKLTSEYSERLWKLTQLVDHIRSSLEFEAESDEESASGTDTPQTEANELDATFAAVTSVPDQKVELMEEARTPQGNKQNDDPEAPASPDGRDTILDLSKIEAVNSPFYNSEMTFSLENEPGEKMLDASTGSQGRAPTTQKDRLQTVQRNVFRESLQGGKEELELLRTTLTSFQQDFVLHRERLAAFVYSQQSSLRQLTDDSSTFATREAQLLKERDELFTGLSMAKKSVMQSNDRIRQLSMDLEASRRGEERLRGENDASHQRIANLQQDLVDLEYRILGPSGRGTSRTNSFQERIEASLSEQSSSTEMQEHHRHLRSELAEAIREKEAYQAEVARLQKIWKDAEVAHGKLKVSFVDSNDRLAAAIERTENFKNTEKELMSAKERETDLSGQLHTLEKQLQSKFSAEMERTKDKFKEVLQTKEESRQQLIEQLDSAMMENEQNTDQIQRLEEVNRKSDDSLNNLKESYATCNNKLAEALDRASKIDDLVSEKEALEAKLEASTLKIEQLEKSEGTETEEMKQHIDQLKSELETAHASHESLKIKYVTVSERLAIAQEKEDELSSAKKEHEDMVEKIRKLETEVAESRSAVASLEHLSEEREAMRESILATKQNLEAITTELGGDLKATQLKLMESLEESQQLRGELNKAVEEKSLLEEAMEKLNGEENENNDACEAAEGLAEVAETRLLDCQNDLEDMRLARDDLLNEIDALQENLLASEAREMELQESCNQMVGPAPEFHALRKELVKFLSLLNDENYSSEGKESEMDMAGEIYELKTLVPSVCETITQQLDKLEKQGDLEVMCLEAESTLMELQSQNHIWENRCYSLKNYMRKLTDKCAEWQAAYAKQSKVLEALQSQQEAAREKAAQLGLKYREENTSIHETNESLADFRSLHGELEDQLERIACQLQNVSFNDPPGELAVLVG